MEAAIRTEAATVRTEADGGGDPDEGDDPDGGADGNKGGDPNGGTDGGGDGGGDLNRGGKAVEGDRTGPRNHQRPGSPSPPTARRLLRLASSRGDESRENEREFYVREE
jgi:hypothetical protein